METGAVVNLRLMQKWFRNVLEYLESVSPNKIFYFFKMPWNLGQRCEWNVGKGLRPTDPLLMQMQKESSILLPQIAVLTDTPEDARGGVLCDARGEAKCHCCSFSAICCLLSIQFIRFSIWCMHVNGFWVISQMYKVHPCIWFFACLLHMQQAPSTSSKVMTSKNTNGS